MVDIDTFVQLTKNGPEKFVLTDEGDIQISLEMKFPTLMRRD